MCCIVKPVRGRRRDSGRLEPQWKPSSFLVLRHRLYSSLDRITSQTTAVPELATPCCYDDTSMVPLTSARMEKRARKAYKKVVVLQGISLSSRHNYNHKKKKQNHNNNFSSHLIAWCYLRFLFPRLYTFVPASVAFEKPQKPQPTVKMRTTQIVSLAFALAGYSMAAPAPQEASAAIPTASASGSSGSDGPLLPGREYTHYCEDPSNYAFQDMDVQVTPEMPTP